MWPHLLFFTDRVPDGFAGVTNGPVIQIRPTHRDDVGLLMHELEHVRQFWLFGLFGVGVALALFWAALPPLQAAAAALAGMALHPVLYRLVPRYRLWAEVQAYVQQLAQPGRLTIELAAEFIATQYRLDVSYASALRLLRKEL